MQVNVVVIIFTVINFSIIFTQRKQIMQRNSYFYFYARYNYSIYLFSVYFKSDLIFTSFHKCFIKNISCRRNISLIARTLDNCLSLDDSIKQRARLIPAFVLHCRVSAADSDHYKLRQMRIEALFQIGEFSRGLALAHDSMRLRTTFGHYVHQAEGTINDCIGKNTSPIALLLLYPWIQRLQKHREFLIGKREEEEENEFKGIVPRTKTSEHNTFSRYHRAINPRVAVKVKRKSCIVKQRSSTFMTRDSIFLMVKPKNALFFFFKTHFCHKM